MQAAISFKNNGEIALRLDADAARVVFASVLFAARYHEGFGPLEQLARQGLDHESQKTMKRGEPCR